MQDTHEFEDGKLVVFKRAQSPYWQMRIYVPGTRKYVRASLKTTDLHAAVTEARRRYMRVVVKLEEGIPVFELAMGKAFDLWLADCESLCRAGEYSESVLRVQRGAVKRYLRSYFKERPLTSIKHGEGDDYWRWRIEHSKTGKAPSKITLGAEINTVNCVIEWAERQKHIKLGSVPRLKRPTALRKRKPNKRAFFTQEDIQLMFSKLGHWVEQAKNEKERMSRTVLKYAVKIIYYSGMRTNDIPLFRWRDIAEPVEYKGKRHAKFFLRGKVEPKWIVPLPAAYLFAMQWKRFSPCTEPDDMVFSYQKGEEPILEQSFRIFLKKYSLWQDADGQTRSLYSLRHSHAVEALLSGVPIEDLARNMRTTVQMIEQHYGQVTNPEKASVVTRRTLKMPFEDDGEPKGNES